MKPFLLLNHNLPHWGTNQTTSNKDLTLHVLALSDIMNPNITPVQVSHQSSSWCKNCTNALINNNQFAKAMVDKCILWISNMVDGIMTPELGLIEDDKITPELHDAFLAFLPISVLSIHLRIQVLLPTHPNRPCATNLWDKWCQSWVLLRYQAGWLTKNISIPLLTILRWQLIRNVWVMEWESVPNSHRTIAKSMQPQLEMVSAIVDWCSLVLTHAHLHNRHIWHHH